MSNAPWPFIPLFLGVFIVTGTVSVAGWRMLIRDIRSTKRDWDLIPIEAAICLLLTSMAAASLVAAVCQIAGE